MSRVGRRTRALLLEQRLTRSRGSNRLYQARRNRYFANWKVMVF